jgi:hypothetical protein
VRRVARVAAVVAVVLAVGACSTGSTSLSGATTTLATDVTTTTATTEPPATTSSPTLSPTTVALTTTLVPTSPTTSVATTSAPTTIVESTVAAPDTTPSPTVAPETTTAPPQPTTTAPPQTTPPATTLPPPTGAPSGCIACRPEYVFAYPNHFEVPQLGSEPVRGSGCGADGNLSLTMPDGIWNGFVKVSSNTLTIDVQCIYYGASAKPFIDACEADHPDDECAEFHDFWKVNNNPRTRSVPLDPGFRRRYESSNCTDPGPGKGTSAPAAGESGLDSWLIIENGRAVFALTSCVYG